MIHTKRVIFMILPLLFVPLVYGLSSTPDACALPKDHNWGKTGDCVFVGEVDPTGPNQMACCWDEPDILNPGEEITYCQTCTTIMGETVDCGPVVSVRGSSSTGPLVLPDEGVVDEPPTPPPTSPFAPPVGGIFQEPLTTTTTPPPLFGRNVPLQGGGVFGQPAITAATPVPTPPLFGQAIPEGPATLAGEGENIQPMNTTFPTPQPFPPPTPGFKAPQTSIDISPDLAPEVDQDETDDDGRNNIPDTGITEQPETQQPEDSSEGAETAGPLT